MERTRRNLPNFINLLCQINKSKYKLPFGSTRIKRYFSFYGRMKQLIHCNDQFVTGVQSRLLFNAHTVTSKRNSILFEKNNKELMTHGNEILHELLTRNDLTVATNERFKNELSGILYQYFNRDHKKHLLKMFQLISDKKQCNEACYTIMMRYFADRKEFDQVKYFFNKLEEDRTTPIHARSFVPMVTVCLRTNNYDRASYYFNQLVEHTQKDFKDTSFQDIIAECAEHVNIENGKYLGTLVHKIFFLLEEFGSRNLHSKTVSAIRKWFERDPFITWKIIPSFVDKSGICKSCNQQLQPVSMPKERLIRLKRSLMTLIEASIARRVNTRLTDVKPLKTNINIRNKIESQAKYFELFDIVSMKPSGEEKEVSGNVELLSHEVSKAHEISPEVFAKLKDLREYLDAREPFDVVIDVLNIGYFIKGFNPLQVRDILSSFIGKRCLLLCAGILKKDILEQDPVAPANRRIKQLLKYMEKNFNLFFVGSSVIDDYYILYTIQHHNFNIELVSRDLFRDHLFHLDSENTSDFQRWQKANQHLLQSFTTDNKPVFKERTTYKVAMQKNDNGCWHVPVSDTEWLCIKKTTGFS